MIRKPPEINDDEWEMLISPENYYCDGEVTRAEADALFKRKVERLVASRRANLSTPPRRPVSTRKSPQPTNAAAVSRVLNTLAGGGYLVTQLPRRRVMVQVGRSSGLHRAAQVLRDRGYVFQSDGQCVVVTGRNT